jgi:hypothetical protein
VPLTAISIQGYRSIQRLHFDVDACSIFIGANGVGKTNLYKALGLLRSAADGNLTRAIAQEGGIESVLWAGRRPGKKPVRLALSAQFETLQYDVESGLPAPPPFNTEAAFAIEPLVREERLIMRTGQRKVPMMERKGPMVALRNDDGVREVHKAAVLSSETALAAFRDQQDSAGYEAGFYIGFEIGLGFGEDCGIESEYCGISGHRDRTDCRIGDRRSGWRFGDDGRLRLWGAGDGQGDDDGGGGAPQLLLHDGHDASFLRNPGTDFPRKRAGVESVVWSRSAGNESGPVVGPGLSIL